MSFQPGKLIIFVTVVCSITLAQPICKRLLDNGTFPFMQVSEHALVPTADPQVFMVKPEDFLSHFETVTLELKNTSSAELLTRFEELVQIEENDHGGLTGIRDKRYSVRDLIVDLAQQPSSQRLFSNYFRNELSSLQAFGVYPTFFAHNISFNQKTMPVRLKTKFDHMSPTSDFRIYTSLLQREVIRRLVEDPKKFFLQMGIEYPKDDSVLKESLEDLESLIYYSR